MVTTTHQLSIPHGFPVLLKKLTKSILQINPPNLEEFCLHYFEREARSISTSGSNVQRKGLEKFIRSHGEEGLKQFIYNLFSQADVDGNGYLCPTEFRNVLNALSKKLLLSLNETRRMLVGVDVNQDGFVSWEEFLTPVSRMIRKILLAKPAQPAQQLASNDEIVHGLSKDDWLGSLMDSFNAADLNGDGVLDEVEFARCLRDPNLGLTSTEITVMRTEVDVNGDGKVSYAEFAQVCASLASELQYADWVPLPRDISEAMDYLLFLFAQNGVKADTISSCQLLDVLLEAELGLPKSQLLEFISECQESKSIIDLDRLIAMISQKLVDLFGIAL